MSDRRYFANVLGAAAIAGFFGALFALFIVPIPTENRDLVTYMIGQLSGFAGGVFAHHYASKSGDREADQMRAETQSKALDTVQAAIAAVPPGRPKGTPDDPVAVEEVR